jgi:hypothetical protein
MNREYTRNELLLSVSNVSLSLGEGSERRLILRDVNAEARANCGLSWSFWYR